MSDTNDQLIHAVRQEDHVYRDEIVADDADQVERLSRALSGSERLRAVDRHEDADVARDAPDDD